MSLQRSKKETKGFGAANTKLLFPTRLKGWYLEYSGYYSTFHNHKMQSSTLILKGESNGNLEVVSCLVKLFHFPVYSRERKKRKETESR